MTVRRCLQICDEVEKHYSGLEKEAKPKQYNSEWDRQEYMRRVFQASAVRDIGQRIRSEMYIESFGREEIDSLTPEQIKEAVQDKR